MFWRKCGDANLGADSQLPSPPMWRRRDFVPGFDRWGDFASTVVALSPRRLRVGRYRDLAGQEIPVDTGPLGSLDVLAQP